MIKLYLHLGPCPYFPVFYPLGFTMEEEQMCRPSFYLYIIWSLDLIFLFASALDNTFKRHAALPAVSAPASNPLLACVLGIGLDTKCAH